MITMLWVLYVSLTRRITAFSSITEWTSRVSLYEGEASGLTVVLDSRISYDCSTKQVGRNIIVTAVCVCGPFIPAVKKVSTNL
jgi:hypothetical protein